MNTYSLLNSVQAGSFTNTNRHIDFVYSGNGVLDLSQCFVQLVMRLDTASTEVHNMVVKNTNGALTIKNVDLIRNAWLMGDKVGKLEDITRVNVLQSNLMEMTKSTTEKMAMIDTLYQTRDFQEGMLLSPFVEMHKEGSVASFYRDVYLRIPLSQLFSLGSLTALDTAKTGALRVHVELENLSYLQVVEALLFKKPIVLNQSQMENITETTNQLITSENFVYRSLDQSPYFVGQRLNVGWASGPADGTEFTVTALSLNPITKQITITSDTSFTVPTAEPLEEVFVIEVEEVLPVSIQIPNAYLGICEVMGAKMEGDILEYTTWSTEQYSNNSKSLDKVFEVEGNAVNAFLMFNNNDSNLISHNDKVSDYRMRIDNSDVYDRNINVNKNDEGVLTHDPLHYDSINRTMLNAALPLKNLTFLNMVRDITAAAGGENDLTLAERYDDKTSAQLIVACPLPETSMSKKVQFTVNTKDGDNKVEGVILFKQIIKSVKMK
jgi:hypothetical protein